MYPAQKSLGGEDRAHAADFEHGGVKGRSAMEAAWDSALEAEIYGEHSDSSVVALLLDLSK